MPLCIIPDNFAEESLSDLLPKLHRRKRTIAVLKLLKYVKEVHCIAISRAIAEDLLEAYKYSAYYNFFEVPEETVDAIVLTCKEWKQYLSDPADFDRLFFYQLITMVTTHTCVFSTYFCEKAGFIFNPKPDRDYSVIINRHGKVKQVQNVKSNQKRP